MNYFSRLRKEKSGLMPCSKTFNMPLKSIILLMNNVDGIHPTVENGVVILLCFSLNVSCT